MNNNEEILNFHEKLKKKVLKWIFCKELFVILYFPVFLFVSSENLLKMN